VPRVSVIIAAYNAEKVIEAAISSIVSQTFEDWECILCDDGSTDNTEQAIRKAIGNDPRFTLLKNDENMGHAKTRNRCISIARGEYIAVQDADDVSVESRLQEEVDFLDKNPGVSVISAYAEFFGEDGETWGEIKPPEAPSLRDWAKGSSIVHAAAMIRRKDLLSVGAYDERYFRVEDYDLWLRMIARGFSMVTLPRVLYRVHWDIGDYSRKKIKDRISEVFLKLRAFRYLGMPLRYCPYILKPLLVGILPSRLVYLHHVRRFQRLSAGAECVREGQGGYPVVGDPSDSGTGILAITLDFELYWGMRDKLRLDRCRKNVLGARQALTEMLRLFDEYKVHATWASVGFLFFDNTEDLARNIPELLPEYRRAGLSPYPYILASGELERDCHFAPELIEAIRGQEGQEIGSHTFSHYCCLEDGQSIDAFREDLRQARKAAGDKGIDIRSMVFPRNQVNIGYLPVLNEAGIVCYRGNQDHWIYRAANGHGDNLLKRMVRLIDAYLNISGYHTYDLGDCKKGRPFSFPSSRFLRPYPKGFSLFEPLRMRRITMAMDDAARRGKVFHIWWHPHNFGTNTRQNMVFLQRILDHYARLRETCGMKSLNMGELSRLFDEDRTRST
jgi:glycosyltransferase involved in cell wall biosynthesis/peptidoglycan/xylan/chitin deacetylase (PgdA/CDA1 family)